MFNLFNKKFIAFTLAEVLMISGVVAIVATLTVPNLKKGYTDKALRAGAKATYFKLESALSAIDVNETIRGESLGSTDASMKLIGAIGENLKLNNFCGLIHTEDVLCFADTIYEPDDPTKKDPTYTAISRTDAKRKICADAILSDGSAISLCAQCVSAFSVPTGVAESDIVAVIYIDANGPFKDPNEMGKDIFLAAIANDSLVWDEALNPELVVKE